MAIQSTESDVEWKVDVITPLLKLGRCSVDIHHLCSQGVQVSHDRYRSMWLVVGPSCEWCPNLAVAD
ncbi:hypothetical protein F2Q69_00030416 [Brassica cretica]|uniref:Uncharacterized protein n=1 Tax=Brassica cretica TaxID=69181 RepID=A0A8S9S8S3_BRACR|nr:hypothetical protein F2Q69_00030416 [Brassica cretica]